MTGTYHRSVILLFLIAANYISHNFTTLTIFKCTIILLGNHHHCSSPENFDLTELQLCASWIATRQPLAPPSTSCLRESDSSTGAPRSGITRCLSFCAWIISLDMMSPGFIHIVAGVGISFLFKKGSILLHWWMDHILFTHHLSTDTRAASGFWPLWIVPLRTWVHKELHKSLGGSLAAEPQDRAGTVQPPRNRRAVSRSSRTFHVPTSGARGSRSYTSLPTLFFFFLKK